MKVAQFLNSDYDTMLKVLNRWYTGKKANNPAKINAYYQPAETLLLSHSMYVAHPNGTHPTGTKDPQDTQAINIVGNSFTLYNAGIYHGTVSNYAYGKVLNLPGAGTPTGLVAKGNTLTITLPNGSSFTVQGAPGQDFSGQQAEAVPDGTGGVSIRLLPSSPVPVGEQPNNPGPINVLPGQEVVGENWGVQFVQSAGTLDNGGVIAGSNDGGVDINGSGTVVNTGYISGLTGVQISGYGKIVNSGGITGTDGTAALIGDGGNVTNEAGGWMNGTSGGLVITSALGTLINNGTIAASTGTGAELTVGGVVNNGSGAAVVANAYGVWMPSGSGSLSQRRRHRRRRRTTAWRSAATRR